MNGRMQNELRIETSINKKLERLPQYVKDWNTNLKASKRTASTRRDYINKIYRLLTFINKENPITVSVNDINESIISEYFLSVQTKTDGEEIKYTSDSYQRSTWNCINNFLEYLKKRQLIEENYISYIKKPQDRDLDRINENRVLLTEVEFREILSAIEKEKNETRKSRDKAIILLFMNTGMRKTALLSIMLEDIDFSERTLTIIDKGNKRHQYNLSDIVLESLDEWLNNRHNFLNGKHDRHLFLSDHGNAMNPNSVYNVVTKYTVAALGKQISPHKLRAGYCSILYNKTHDAEFVRRAVGHANISTTQRYIVTKGDERKKASDIMASIL